MATQTPDQIRAQFDQQGYFVAKNVYAPHEVAELEIAFDKIVEQLLTGGGEISATWKGPEMEKLGAQKSVVIHTHNVQQFSAVWLRAILHDRFLDVASAILGEDIVLHHTKLFQKPPEQGAPFPMHQDWTYFPSEKDSMIAGIIHVSEATDEMGCLRVVPGSHKLGRVEGTSGQTESELLRNHPLESAIPLEASPGDVAFFHYFTLHGSMPNLSQKTRKTVLAQLYSGHDQIERDNRHTDERLVLKGWNHRSTRERAGAPRQET